MNKNLLRQLLVILAVIATITINALADILPINGLGTGQISDTFKVFFVPAGYVFSIWGVIYLGFIAYAVYQALPSQRENPRLKSISNLFLLSSLANCAWIFLWHYQLFVWTLVAMFTLLVSLILIYVRLGIGRQAVSRAETWLAHVPFSIYLGWITVATIANVTSVLDFVKWNGFGIAPQIWAAIMLAVGVLVAGLMAVTRRDLAYLLVLVWAFIGIALKFPAVPVVAYSAWIASAAVGLFFVALLVLKVLPKRTA
ncbi:MAG: tryptophan-rich sensory protein [Anaerolineaceae bacterium]